MENFTCFLCCTLTKRRKRRGRVSLNRLLSIFGPKRGEGCWYKRIRLTCKMGG
jgi:hypothetical protein